MKGNEIAKRGSVIEVLECNGGKPCVFIYIYVSDVSDVTSDRTINVSTKRKKKTLIKNRQLLLSEMIVAFSFIFLSIVLRKERFMKLQHKIKSLMKSESKE